MTLPAESARLILRRFGPEDAPVLAAYRSVPEVARYQSWDTPFAPAAAEELIARVNAVEPFTPGAWIQIALEEKASGTVIGDLACQVDANDPELAEVGFTLAPAWQHRGFASEALLQLLRLLAARGIARVQAVADARNAGSLGVLRRCGFLHRETWTGRVFKGESCTEELWEKGLDHR